MSIIEVKNITKIFGKNPKAMLALANEGVGKAEMQEKHNHALGLHDINLTIEQGEVFVIMGLSGSGKSTLIRHFNRLIEPTDGQILINNQDVTAMSPEVLREFRRTTMSMVFQHFGLLPHKTVLQNASYAQIIRGVPKEQAYKKGKQWLETVGLAGYEDYYPKKLSGGQQQRVGLARALAADTDIMLMDEAFSALDPLIRGQMQEQLLELQEQFNKTIVFITHDLDEALRIGSRIAILNDGKVAQVGTAKEILTNPADDYVKEFVQKVNRASALTLGSIMQKPQHIFEKEDAKSALTYLKSKKLEWACICDEGVYKGIITLDLLNKAMEKDSDANLVTLAEKRKAFVTTDTIEKVIPNTIGNANAVPVVDAHGKLKGIIEAEDIIKAIA